jgi:hypothetical protein
MRPFGGLRRRVGPHSLALAYSLSSIAGLRASLTILALSIAIHTHVFAPPQPMAWLGADATLIVAAIFAVADFFADKIPWVDHVVHAVHAVLAPVAGGVAAAAVDPSGASSVAIAGIAGGVNALGVHGLRATTRAGSSAVSGGALNPVISFVEDVAAIGGLVLAFIAPFVIAVIALVMTLAFALLGRRIVHWLRPKPAPTA